MVGKKIVVLTMVDRLPTILPLRQTFGFEFILCIMCIILLLWFSWIYSTYHKNGWLVAILNLSFAPIIDFY